jgi:hypothetical protein
MGCDSSRSERQKMSERSRIPYEPTLSIIIIIYYELNKK